MLRARYRGVEAPANAHPAVVFTDLTGYTNTVSRSDREALRELIASHEMLVAPVVERFGGRIVKNLRLLHGAVRLRDGRSARLPGPGREHHA